MYCKKCFNVNHAQKFTFMAQSLCCFFLCIQRYQTAQFARHSASLITSINTQQNKKKKKIKRDICAAGAGFFLVVAKNFVAAPSRDNNDMCRRARKSRKNIFTCRVRG